MKEKLKVNGVEHELDLPPMVPLLWVIREELMMTGTKFGCGVAMCGACTVHLDGEAVRSCVTPWSAAVGHEVTTVEGLDGLHRVQVEWVIGSVPQCGYCQSGQVMQAAALLKAQPKPTDEDIDIAMGGNICRCGTYPRIRKAIHAAAGEK